MCHLCDLESIIESARDDAKRAASERDALRKALEPFSDLLDGLDNEHDNAPIEIEVSIMERGVFTVGDLRRAHAALHGTAKQESPHINIVNNVRDRMESDGASLIIDPIIKAQFAQPKPRTCGECAHYKEGTGRCRSMISTRIITLACDLAPIECFQPRADAQKEAP